MCSREWRSDERVECSWFRRNGNEPLREPLSPDEEILGHTDLHHGDLAGGRRNADIGGCDLTPRRAAGEPCGGSRAYRRRTDFSLESCETALTNCGVAGSHNFAP